MNNFEINKAIAEICGWKDCYLSIESVYGFPPERKWVGIPPNRINFEEIPNYAGCLNAMHEAEKMLKDWSKYVCFVAKVITGDLRPRVCGNLYHVATAVIISATARQRAEAFLRTFNKWKN